jgi:hypothetical protein
MQAVCDHGGVHQISKELLGDQIICDKVRVPTDSP